MKCQSCAKPATVHLTDIVDGKKRVRHLCQSCAEQQQLVTHQELNLPAILQTLIGQHVGQLSDELARLTCPVCGIKYMEFRAEGRLGCPHDYDEFREDLLPLLENIHGDPPKHAGKTPRRLPQTKQTQSELVQLRKQLLKAVNQENYEEAARLRDRIKQLEDS